MYTKVEEEEETVLLYYDSENTDIHHSILQSSSISTTSIIDIPPTGVISNLEPGYCYSNWFDQMFKLTFLANGSDLLPQTIPFL